MTDKYEVLTDELTAHAGKLHALTERLRTAADAANQATMNDDAYGVICQPFAMMLQPFEQMGLNAVRQGVGTLSDTADKVRKATTHYDTTETAEAAKFRGVNP